MSQQCKKFYIHNSTYREVLAIRNYKDALENQINIVKESVLNEVKTDIEDVLYQSELISQQSDINKVLELNTKSIQLLKELINKLT